MHYMSPNEEQGEKKDWSSLLDSDLFSNAGKTQHLVRRAESMAEKRQKKPQGLKYKEAPTHLFPEHPKSPYFQEGSPYADYEVNIAYTINFLLDLKAALKGEQRSNPESITDRNYIALMAREHYLAQHNKRPLREVLLNALEDAAAPDIAQRYGWELEYVRKGLLEKCVQAMVGAFNKRPELFSIYEKTEKTSKK
jgi:hypothetical protein